MWHGIESISIPQTAATTVPFLCCLLLLCCRIRVPRMYGIIALSFFLKIESAGAAGAAAGEPTTGDREADRQP